MRKYNYVIFGSSWDLYMYSYSDLFGLDDVQYISDMKLHSNLLYRICFGKMNQLFSVPFKSLWNPFFYNDKFQNERPICFVFFAHWYEIAKTTGFISYLRNKYTDSKIVIFFQDLVSTHPGILDSLEEVDLLFSFDQGDADKYNFLYHPLVFSKYKESLNTNPSVDVYFLGKPKNRYEDIIETVDLLYSEGLKLDINIVGVPTIRQERKSIIKYIDTMPYLENLMHINNSKCVLEVMQKGGTGLTQRGVEIVGLNKKLLTNNPLIHNAPFYNPKYISQFTKPEDIDTEFLSNIKNNEVVDYHYQENVSPIEFINHIDSCL